MSPAAQTPKRVHATAGPEALRLRLPSSAATTAVTGMRTAEYACHDPTPLWMFELPNTDKSSPTNSMLGRIRRPADCHHTAD